MQQSSIDGNPADELTGLRTTIITTWAMALVAVCLRFLARRLSKAGLWYDDWLMIPATVSTPYMIILSTTPVVQENASSSHIYQLVSTALCFNVAPWSKSSHSRESRETFQDMLTIVDYPTVVNSTIAQWTWTTTEKSDDLDYLEKDASLAFFIPQIGWAVVLWTVKCSILAFYWRLFSRNGRSIRFAVWTIAVGVMCWGITVVRRSL